MRCLAGLRYLRRQNALSLKRHLFPHGGRAKIQAQGFLDLFFDATPHLEYFFKFFELNTKAAFAKAAFDILRLFERKQKGGFVKGWFWRMYPRSGFGAGEHPHVPSCSFLVPGNIRMYPRSGFCYQGTSAKTTLLETTLLWTPTSGSTLQLRNPQSHAIPKSVTCNYRDSGK